MKKMIGIGVILVCCVLWQFAGTASAEEFSLPELESGKVVLTWTELKTLLDELESLKQAQKEEKQETKEETPPVEYSIAEARLQGIVEGETVRFTADFSVNILKAGWVQFPFFTEHVGIESLKITLDDGLSTDSKSLLKGQDVPAQLVRNQNGYAFMGKGPGAFKIEMVFHVPLKVENLTHTLAFTPPPSVVNRITLKIPEKGVNILRAEPAGRVISAEDTTTFQTVLTRQDLFSMAWKIEKDSGVYRRSTARVHALASVERTAMSVSASIELQHLSSLEQVELLLPPDVDILSVSSADIERWTTAQSEEAQMIRLAGQFDVRKPVTLALTYRMQLPALPAEVEIPMLRINGVETLDGFLGVEVLGNLEVNSGKTGNKWLIPAKNLPDALWQGTISPLLLGYEFHDSEFQARLNIKSFQELQTVVANVDLVDCITHRTLEGKSITSVRYFIRNNDRQFLTLTLPEHSRIWQAFLDGTPVKPAQKETGEILLPMKKSTAQGEELQSFIIELGYITEVNKLSLKGELTNELPGLDLPSSYLRWSVYLPEDYEYTNFEGPLKQISQFSNAQFPGESVKAHIDIPTQGKQVLFEKYLVVDETPYFRAKYGQYLGDDIFLSLQPGSMQTLQQVTPMSRYK